MKKECNIVMLAIDNPSNIVQIHPDTISYTTTESISGGEYQHLYITSDEKIKEGDWVYYKHPINKFPMITKIINWNYSKEASHAVKHIEGYGVKEGYKKIIATTDTSLGITDHRISPVPNFCDLPQIPQSFIDTFIEEYNKGNVIDKVLVEYDEILYVKTCFDGGIEESDLIIDLHINLDNTINISLIEKKYKLSFNQLMKIFDQGFKYCSESHLTTLTPTEYLDEWIKKNLK